jgi:hypothetical protein
VVDTLLVSGVADSFPARTELGSHLVDIVMDMVVDIAMDMVADIEPQCSPFTSNFFVVMYVGDFYYLW